MRLHNVLVYLLFGLLFASTASFACDANESCHDQCAWGVCVKDWVCEGRKAACRVPVVGPIVTAPGSPLSPGGVLGQGGPGLGPVSGEDLKKCISNPSSCGSVILGDVAFAAVQPVVDQYLGYLDQQAMGKLKSLPPDVTAKLQPFYPELALNEIQYAEEINTRHGQNMTVEKTIYFVGKVNFGIVADDALLTHELQHSVQYARRGGRAQFLAEYIAKAAAEIIKHQSIDIHDDIELERDAITKSTEVMAALGWMPLQNGFWRYSGGGGWFGITGNHTVTLASTPGASPSTSSGGVSKAMLPFGPANGSIIAQTQWIALQDPGSSGSFFKTGDHPVQISQLKVGDEIYSDRDINVRHRAADWGSVAFVLPKGSRVHINQIKSLRAGSGQQLWGAVDIDGRVKR